MSIFKNDNVNEKIYRTNNEKIEHMRLEELGLSDRTYSMLKRAGKNTVGDMMRPRDEGRMMGSINIGRKALEEFYAKVKELGWGDSSQNDAYTEKNHPGREKCDTLRKIRKKIADANGIDYEPAECHHTGPCMGTCPVCDAEIEFIDKELRKKKENGEEIIILGISSEEIKKSGCNTNPEVEVEGIKDKDWENSPLMGYVPYPDISDEMESDFNDIKLTDGDWEDIDI